MAWDRYEIDPDGAYVFLDTQAGAKLRLAGTPSVVDFAKSLPPLAPQQPQELPPEKIVVDQSPTLTMDLARKDTGETAPPVAVPSMPPAPPPPPPQPTGADLSTPKEIASQAPLASMMPPAAASGGGGGGGAATGPGKIVFTPGMNTAGFTPEQMAAYLHWQAAQKAAAGSPGRFVPGGTFPTAKSVQFAEGPHPENTLQRELAEQEVGKVQSDLAHVQSRAALEQAEHAEAQQKLALARAARLEEIHKRESAKLGDVFGQIEQTQRELTAAGVDSDKLVKSMSTWRQVGVAIAMVLGGLGQAIQGKDAPPMAMQVFNDAIAKDIEAQKYAIEKKRGDLNALGQVYQLAKDHFNDEKMASDAAWLAGSEIIKAKIQRTIAEADAAQGVETQWADGQIVSGAPYSMKAKLMLAQLAAEQAQKREALSQAMRGQVAQQYVTTQDTVTGGKAPDYAKAAEEADKAAKSLNGDEQQQVMFDGQRYKLGKFAESGEGKETRKDLGQIENLDRTAAELQQYLTDNPIGSKTYDASVVKGKMERLSSGMNVMLGQGAKNNDEARRWEEILGGVLTNGVGAVKDARSWLKDLGQRKLDQLSAKPFTPGGGIAPPQGLQDIASGKAKPTGGGVVGMPQRQAPAPVGPIVRSSGALASPLDRATAAIAQARSSDGKAAAGAQTAARTALRQAHEARELDPAEYRRASEMVDARQYDALFDYLGRVRGTVSQQRPAAAQVSPAVAVLLSKIRREATAGLDAPASVQTMVTTTTAGGKGKGKGGGAPKAGKIVQPNLMPAQKKAR